MTLALIACIVFACLLVASLVMTFYFKKSMYWTYGGAFICIPGIIVSLYMHSRKPVLTDDEIEEDQ